MLPKPVGLFFVVELLHLFNENGAVAGVDAARSNRSINSGVAQNEPKNSDSGSLLATNLTSRVHSAYLIFSCCCCCLLGLSERLLQFDGPCWMPV